jgi:hypothetical protein
MPIGKTCIDQEGAIYLEMAEFIVRKGAKYPNGNRLPSNTKFRRTNRT